MTGGERVEHLVVVGASAGGIEALSILVGGLGAEFPAPVVLAQHLDPNRPSHLGTILERRTPLPVVTVGDSTPLERGTIYVVPSNRHVVITDGHVALQTDHADRPRPSIDLLLSSAARVYGERLVAVILTGSGSDGATGAVDVKQAGGVVLIQNPRTAAHPSMPMALPPTAVDHVANIEQMGQLLLDIVTGVELPPSSSHAADDSLAEILGRVTRHTSIDFNQYKPTTLLRRIGRRMAVNHVRTLEEYRDLLDNQPREIGELTRSLLIKVTEFFRDPEAFEFLQRDVLQPLIESARDRRSLRLWSAGCATGEEAYSIAMVVSSMLGQEFAEWDVKIFATDVDHDAIVYARRGLYPDTVLANVPQDMRSQHFEPADHGMRVHKGLRQRVIFGQQDLSRGVPFPRIDLVVCRNLLIYFKPELQADVLDLFAYSLHQTRGYLFLGKAETARPSKATFELTNKKWKLYRCSTGSLPMPRRSLGPRIVGAIEPAPPLQEDMPARVPRMTSQAFELELATLRRVSELALRGVAAGIAVIDRSYRTLSINPAARRLLAIREGAIDQDFLHTARALPYQDVRTAIDRVFREGGTMTLPEVPVEDGARFVSLHIATVQHDSGPGELVVVTCLDVTDAVHTRGSVADLEVTQKRLLDELGASNRRLTEVNKELQEANEELQAANEEMMLSQEELQATNEEFEATNEELQATNEELETNNEELQATNEELETTNEELQARSQELQELARLLSGERTRLSEMVELAPFCSLTLRGPALRVDAYHPVLQLLFGDLKAQGYPFAEACTDRAFEPLVSAARRALDEGLAWGSDRIRVPDGATPRYMVFTVVPSRAADAHAVDGVIVYAEDVTGRRQHEQNEYVERLRLMLDHAEQVAMALFDAASGRMLHASRRFRDMLLRVLGGDRAAVAQPAWSELWFGPVEGVHAFLDVARDGRPRRLPEVRVSEGGQESVWDFSLIPIAAQDGGDGTRFVLVTSVEVTEPVTAREDLERIDRLKDEFLSLASHELRTPLAPLTTYTELFGRMLDQQPRDAEWEAKMRQMLARFGRQVRHMTRLADDLLDMARLQSGKFSLDLKRVAVRDVVDEAVEQSNLAGDRPPIDIAFAVDGDTVLRADALRATQAVHNLVANAIRHAPESDRIEVRVVRSPDDANRVRIAVRDFGRGVPKRERKHLFERYFQTDSAGGARSGLGLGLYIARQIALQHGGSIGADYHDRGTTFWIDLREAAAVPVEG